MIELGINSLPNRSTEYLPFFLNCEFHPVVPFKLLKCNEMDMQKNVNSFVQKLDETWDIAVRKIKHVQELQEKCYDTRHKPVEHDVNQLLLLSIVNFKVRGTPSKLKKRFMGYFKVVECIGRQAYRSALPENWRIHLVFYESLLKPWRESSFMQVSQSSYLLEIEDSDDQSLYQVEGILRWRTTRIGHNNIRRFYVPWKGYPLSEASWEPEVDFPDK